MKMRIINYTLCLLPALLPVIAKAQDAGETQNKEVHSQDLLVETNDVGILYKYEMTGGIFAHSNGFGINYRRGKNTTGYSKRIFELEAATIKNAKEYKRYNPSKDSKGYVYGKMNALLALRASVGQQRVIAGKTDMGGIEIRYVYTLGASLGILKPVYLMIIKEMPHSQTPQIVTEKYDPALHFPNDISGKGPMLRGVDELKFVPGGYAKFGLSFEYNNDPTRIRSLETGMMLDAYYKRIPIMADMDLSDDFDPNNMFFFGFYISLNYGKRW